MCMMIIREKIIFVYIYFHIHALARAIFVNRLFGNSYYTISSDLIYVNDIHKTISDGLSGSCFIIWHETAISNLVRSSGWCQLTGPS